MLGRVESRSDACNDRHDIYLVSQFRHEPCAEYHVGLGVKAGSNTLADLRRLFYRQRLASRNMHERAPCAFPVDIKQWVRQRGLDSLLDSVVPCTVADVYRRSAGVAQY